LTPSIVAQPIATSAEVSSTIPEPPPTRTVQLAVVPASVTVEIDGAQVSNRHGHVDVTGALGSVHHVRIALGSMEKRGDVVIATTGVLPAEMALSIEAARTPAARAQSLPVSSAPTKGSESNIDRDFR
jgi:hypothetical protein